MLPLQDAHMLALSSSVVNGEQVDGVRARILSAAVATYPLHVRRCQPSESREAALWVKEHHYLRSTPPGFAFVLEFLSKSELVGMMIMGRASGRKLDQDRILQLYRMVFLDEAPKNVESRALAMMRRFVRTWYPNVRLLLSYSDPTVGHTGAIYEADGWAQFGETGKKNGYGWKSRPNRASDPVTSKIRWVRTP